MQIQLTVDDYLSAIRAGMRPRRSFAVIGLILVALTTIAFVVMLARLAMGKGSWTDAICVLAICYLPFWYWIYLPWKVHRVYGQQRSMQRTYSADITPSGLHVQSEHSQGLAPWSDFWRWRETAAVFVLYHSDAVFSMLPKRAFDSPAAQDELRALLEREIGPVGKARQPR